MLGSGASSSIKNKATSSPLRFRKTKFKKTDEDEDAQEDYEDDLFDINDDAQMDREMRLGSRNTEMGRNFMYLKNMV